MIQQFILTLLTVFFLCSSAWAQYQPVGQEHEISYNQSGRKKVHGVLKLYEAATEKTVSFEYKFFAPAHESRGKLIVITPNIEGATPLEFLLKDYLVKRGFSVLIPYALPLDFTFDATTAQQFERASERAFAGTTALIDLLSQTEDFDTSSIGLMGASLGGIRSSILFGLDTRFRAMFVAVAGADFPSLYANSQNSHIRPLREAHMRSLGMTRTSSYENYLRARLTLDPSVVVQSPYLSNVAMVIAEDDKIVPTYNQWQLWRLIKASGVHPKTYISETGHVQGALHLLRYRQIIHNWFVKKL